MLLSFIVKCTYQLSRNQQTCKLIQVKLIYKSLSVVLCFFRFRYKGVVKNDINADYDTYGQEGDVDYITNENVYYEGDYDSMETSQNATVMISPPPEFLKHKSII